MECFRQIVRFVKSPFQKKTHRVLEIGPPTNFRKEELPNFFPDDDHGSALEKDTVKGVQRQPSTRDKIKEHVRRMSIKLVGPSSCHE
ncbi:hypothetical protein IFM47457_10245 [Aspergillus lentulus]|nr:hypothetical protein IFM47457_10245 [Aspergillus lentulus]